MKRTILFFILALCAVVAQGQSWPLSGTKKFTGNVNIKTGIYNLNIKSNSDSLRFFIDRSGSFWEANTLGMYAGDPTLNNEFTTVNLTKGWNEIAKDYAFSTMFSQAGGTFASVDAFAGHNNTTEVRIRSRDGRIRMWDDNGTQDTQVIIDANSGLELTRTITPAGTTLQS